MGFRTVIIKSRAKLEFRLNYLIVRGETEHRVFISEINTLIIQSTAVSLTAALLNELTKRNIKVIFCDEKCNPSSELMPCYGAHNTSKRYKLQFNWDAAAKRKVWQSIVVRKISEQAEVLKERGFLSQEEMLRGYAREVLPGDISNREGHAAKVYFNCILGEGNSRKNDNFFNSCLNYGYTILLSAFNREIVASGYLTQIGIWHDNEFNAFNLSCDLMEPLRPIVDRRALMMNKGEENFKKKLVAILDSETLIDGKITTLDLAIRQYTKSVFRAMEEGAEDKILFPEYVLLKDEL